MCMLTRSIQAWKDKKNISESANCLTNALNEFNDFIGGLLLLRLNVITFRTLLHLGPNVVAFRTVIKFKPSTPHFHVNRP